jgi:hypothetical protein
LTISFILVLGCKDNTLKKFETKKWKTGTQIELGNMSTDLVESKLLIGKNKPKTIAYLEYPKDSTRTNFHYLVDFGYMTPFHLDVSFDVNSLRVKEVTLTD